MNTLKLLLTITILTVTSTTMTAQTIRNYEADWKKAEEYIQKGLPSSAGEVVLQIYKKAKSEKQEAQVVKALVYLNAVQQENRENNEIMSIREIEKEITNSQEPVTSLLNSYLAGLYQQLFARNRFKIYNRTNVEGSGNEDPETWTATDFHKKISELYLNAIKNKELLQRTPLEPWDALITKGNRPYLRPTLYDLLAQRALRYFKSDERDINRPAYAFEISQPEAFADAARFAAFKFDSKDSLSLSYKALLIYQELIRLHLKDEKPDALIDLDLDRLQYVHLKSVNPNSDTYYTEALENIFKKYSNQPAASQALYLLAMSHWIKSIRYQPGMDTANRFELVKAKDLTDKILATGNTKSEGYINAFNLNHRLTTPSYNIQAEKVNIPNQPFRLLLGFKNIQRLYLRIIPATEDLKYNSGQGNSGNNFWERLTATRPIRSWEQALPANTDLQNHSVELKVDALPAGEYFILSSINDRFDQKENILGARLVNISNISLVGNRNDYFVLDRNSGQPLRNAKVQVWRAEYNYRIGTTRKTKFANYSTDRNGFFKFIKTDERERGYNYSFEISHNGDILFMDDAVYYYNTYNSYQAANPKKIDTRVFLFTDRSLYRPGQTVYFKGIAVDRQSDGKNSEVHQGYKSTVYLIDGNHQKADSMLVTAKEFGSFSGRFTLPASRLNGSFSISTADQTGSIGFNVEEYKRPRFYVDFDKPKGSYKLNDSILVSGKALAYAGNTIGGATVRYRVVRMARFPYPWLFWSRIGWPRSPSQEIAHGETSTNQDGLFFIRFQALPDLKTDPGFEPVFDYRIYADVTDINGEVRSNSSMVSVGYKSLIIETEIPERVSIDSLQKLEILTTNMAGAFEKVALKVSLSKLKPEQRLLRDRYWQKPDQFVMTREEYIKNFPNDIYDNENDPRSWQAEAATIEQRGVSDSTGIFRLNSQNVQPGYYLLDISTEDKDGRAVRDRHYVEVYNPRQSQPAYPQYLVSTNPESIEPGQKAEITLSSSAENIFLIQKVSKQSDQYYFSKLSREKKSFTYSATEADRGGYGVSFMFVKNNRIFQVNRTINVPWTNKELKIEYGSFRDKTEPGAEEKWTVRITGNKKEKVAAEMLASMYDASLDQFYPHRWQVPALWSKYFNNPIWVSNNFGAAPAMLENGYTFSNKSYEKNYDQLLDQFSPGARPPGIMIRGLNGRIGAMPAAETMQLNETVVVGYGKQNASDVTGAIPVPQGIADSSVVDSQSGQNPGGHELRIRKNFNETAFFFPDLRTDQAGNIQFSFTMPEALTRWKFQALAHTRQMAMGYSSKEIITQKDLMVQPNIPRFLREGDRLKLSTKVVNLSPKELTGLATLELFDAATAEPVDGWFKNVIPKQYFTIPAGKSQELSFPVEVPAQFNKALTWRITARVGGSGDKIHLSDGEENVVPVLTNRILVTETLPLHMRGTGEKKFRLENLLKSGSSETLTTQGLTVEYSSNPVWFAVQSIPYMMEYPYECAEQNWNRYYANSLATLLANSSPDIKQIFERWKKGDSSALKSNLEKNPELKSLLLEETPWVLQAKNEAAQRKNIALLFDLSRMNGELSKSFEKLRQMQSPNGGFVWFRNGPDDRFITQYIVTGIGHLKKLKAVSGLQESNLNRIVQAAIPYLDKKISEEYNDLVKSKTDLNKYTPSYYVIQYLYMRSFFPSLKLAPEVQKIVDYFTARNKATWTQQNKFMQAMIALAMFRQSDVATAKAILRSLKETAIYQDEMGMYYKDNARSWRWYDAPIERQAMIIEAFEEIGGDVTTADDLRTWLLKNKQTNHWGSTKATAEACYALLLRGSNWLSDTPAVEITLGTTRFNSKEEKTESGTGYFKKWISGEKVKPSMGEISLRVNGGSRSEKPVSQSKNNSVGSSWGAVYWQYFETLDKIPAAASGLKLTKRLFLEKNSDRGPLLTPINDGTIIRVGDKVKVRIEVSADRDMEYLQLKDMRASSFEPVNVLSQYKWQGGLGYYETTRDAGTNFFIDFLPKGSYVFEYDLFATQAGNFSDGISTIQCMYAPEFSSHSKNINITVE